MIRTNHGIQGDRSEEERKGMRKEEWKVMGKEGRRKSISQVERSAKENDNFYLRV